MARPSPLPQDPLRQLVVRRLCRVRLPLPRRASAERRVPQRMVWDGDRLSRSRHLEAHRRPAILNPVGGGPAGLLAVPGVLVVTAAEGSAAPCADPAVPGTPHRPSDPTLPAGAQADRLPRADGTALDGLVPLSTLYRAHLCRARDVGNRGVQSSARMRLPIEPRPQTSARRPASRPMRSRSCSPIQRRSRRAPASSSMPR